MQRAPLEARFDFSEVELSGFVEGHGGGPRDPEDCQLPRIRLVRVRMRDPDKPNVLKSGERNSKNQRQKRNQ